MWNWMRCSGVYCNMPGVVLLICSFAAMAQSSPQQNPLDKAIQAVWQARNSGHFDEAAAGREQARAMLEHAPVDAPQYTGWVQQVAQFYQNAGWNAQARAILQDGLDRAGVLGDSHPSRIAMLSALGESWVQDGNLLKAVGYLERAAAAQAVAPPVAAPSRAMQVGILNGRSYIYRGNIGYAGSRIQAYTRLADLYRQLGRPDAVAAIRVKVRALVSNDETALAQFYEQQGQLEEAAAIYKKLAEGSIDVQAQAGAWQALANLYARQEHFTDAAAAIQQAIRAAQSSDKPAFQGQAVWMRQSQAAYLQQAGQLGQAEQLYRQMVEESRGDSQESQMLGQYAQFLAQTDRAAQGESLMKEYLATRSNLDPQQKMQALFHLASLADARGDSKSADEYRRAGQALQPQPPPPPAGGNSIGEEVRKSETALSQHRVDDAYGLALGIIDAAAQAIDGQQVTQLVAQIAGALEANKEPAKAEQIFRRLLNLARSWPWEGTQARIAATQYYARFLMSQPERQGEVPAALEECRRALIEANGPDSEQLAEPLRMRIDFEGAHGRWDRAQALAQDLLELQDSFSGNTSDPYLTDLQRAAVVFEAAGDTLRALALRRKAIAIADLVAGPDDNWPRAQTRMNAALLLARTGQFDEAESLGTEAVALGRIQRTLGEPLIQELETIRQMKTAAAAAGAKRTSK